mgnify:CR=1 FL=1
MLLAAGILVAAGLAAIFAIPVATFADVDGGAA